MALASILCFVVILIGVFLGTTFSGIQHNVTQAKPTPTLAPTPAFTPTSVPTSQPSIIVETATASVPTPTPLPVINTAQDIYTQFTTAGIAMGNAGDVPQSWWLQCCSYYPAKGSISFIDEASGGNMVIALFSTVNGLQTDVAQMNSNSNHPGNYAIGTCLLLYWSASTNLTPYEQVMQHYCV